VEQGEHQYAYSHYCHIVDEVQHNGKVDGCPVFIKGEQVIRAAQVVLQDGEPCDGRGHESPIEYSEDFFSGALGRHGGGFDVKTCNKGQKLQTERKTCHECGRRDKFALR